MTFLTRSLLWSTFGAAPKQEPSLGCPVPAYCSSPEQMQLASHAYFPVYWFHRPLLSCSVPREAVRLAQVVALFIDCALAWSVNYPCSKEPGYREGNPEGQSAGTEHYLLASTPVIQHHIGNRLDAIGVEYPDAPAQVPLRPVRGIQALVLPWQVSLHTGRLYSRKSCCFSWYALIDSLPIQIQRKQLLPTAYGTSTPSSSIGMLASLLRWLREHSVRNSRSTTDLCADRGTGGRQPHCCNACILHLVGSAGKHRIPCGVLAVRALPVEALREQHYSICGHRPFVEPLQAATGLVSSDND